ncbi:MAG TPA: hypothetical protein VGS58_19770 [Candidatus Sulfopaludibacter sp.]|nr:hypothetical protein [Candidatus Sulfopaludibacter sp.]
MIAALEFLSRPCAWIVLIALLCADLEIRFWERFFRRLIEASKSGVALPSALRRLLTLIHWTVVGWLVRLAIARYPGGSWGARLWPLPALL